MPDQILRFFDHYSKPEFDVDADVDVESTLQAANAVTECDEVDDLCLTDSFQEAWNQRISAYASCDTSKDDLARILAVDPSTIDFTEHGDAIVATMDDNRIGQWESRPAFIADIAAAKELNQRLVVWSRLDAYVQGNVLAGLRIFLERCPACDSPIVVDQEQVKSCCRTIDVVAATCTECDVRLFEIEQAPT